MLDWQGMVSLAVFAVAIILIALDALNLALAAVLGASVLLLLEVVTLREAAGIVAEAHATIVIFLGGIVI